MAKLLAFVSRFFGKGQGTSLPGFLVEKYTLWVLPIIAKEYSEIIMVSGTNGKTTTRSIIVQIFDYHKVSVCTNSGGANLIRGVASSLLLNTGLLGRPLSKKAVFEVEEASLPKLSKYIKPDKLILTNVFRDQLDAYGEVNKTVSYFRETLKNLELRTVNRISTEAKNSGKKTRATNKDFQLIVNLDDPMLQSIIRDYQAFVVGYSLGQNRQSFKYERELGKEVKIDHKYQVRNVEQTQLQTKFEVFYAGEIYKLKSKLPGLYNVYNLVGGYIVGFQEFGKTAIEAIGSVKPVFGRGEKIHTGKSSIHLFLVKNPAGFDQIIDLLNLNYAERELSLGVLINDNIADGKDVSWLWDTNLERLREIVQLKNIFTSGSRGRDMLLRLKYAGFEVEPENFVPGIDILTNQILNSGQDFVVLATYTAMLTFRKEVQRAGFQIPKINSQGF